MQNHKQKFRQGSIVFERPGLLSENLKTDKLQLSTLFLFCLDLNLFAKIKNTWWFLDTLFYILLKVGLLTSKLFIIICFIDSPSKLMKNAFYFILKALFVLKILKFMS